MEQFKFVGKDIYENTGNPRKDRLILKNVDGEFQIGPGLKSNAELLAARAFKWMANNEPDNTVEDMCSRITGQNKAFVDKVKSYVALQPNLPHTAAFIKYCARNAMKDLYGDSIEAICIVEDYEDTFDWDDNMKPTNKTWLVIRFINPITARFFFESITILNLRDEDYESLNIEKVN